MSPMPSHPQFPSTARTSFAQDERGAIMVLGIFMCSVLVGALWYIAGIGDALIWRERIQEASDAAAFSSAALHARGLNLLVLLNLLMAMILGIRVAMKVLQVVCLALGAIFAALSLIPFAGAIFGPASAACFEAAEGLETAIDETREPINQAIKGISKVQVGIMRGVPAAAMAGSIQVGDKYKPPAGLTVGMPNLTRVTKGLQTEEGTEDKLCHKAGESVIAILQLVLDKIPGFGSVLGALMGRVRGAVGDIVAAGAAYFCEIGTSTVPPNLDSITQQGAEETCNGEKDGLQKQYNLDVSDWMTACSKAHAGCEPPILFPKHDAVLTKGSAKDSDMAGLSAGKDKVDADRKAIDTFDWDKCVTQKKKDINDKAKGETKKSGAGTDAPKNTSGNGQGMTPKRLISTGSDKFYNGVNSSEIMGWSAQNTDFKTKFLDRSPKLVRIAAFSNKESAVALDRSTSFPSLGDWGVPDAWSQAEYFYDCPDAWNQCNKDDEAMWHFRWRPRLRRYDSPWPDLKLVTDAVAIAYRLHAEKLVAERGLNGITPANALLRAELVKAPLQTIDLH